MAFFGLIKRSQIEGALTKSWSEGYERGLEDGRRDVHVELDKAAGEFQLQIQNLKSENDTIGQLLETERKKAPESSRKLQLAKRIFLQAKAILDRVDYEHLDSLEFQAKKTQVFEKIRREALDFAKDNKMIEG